MIRGTILITLLFTVFHVNAASRVGKSAPRRGVLFQAEWKHPLVIDFPRILCEKNDYIRSCFHVQESDCRSIVKSQVELCVKEVQVPKTFANERQEVYWAEKVGRCVGNHFETDQARVKKKDWQCRDIKKWL